jgi:alkylhydroperoxidase family enzyme
MEEARKDKEAQDRLDLLNVWREVPIFSERERAALLWTETLTSISHSGVSDAVYNEVATCFGQEELINITAVIVAINSWNRIAIGFHLLPNLN